MYREYYWLVGILRPSVYSGKLWKVLSHQEKWYPNDHKKNLEINVQDHNDTKTRKNQNWSYDFSLPTITDSTLKQGFTLGYLIDRGVFLIRQDSLEFSAEIKIIT